MFGKLYLIATPIGNLGDITYRAVEILKKVDIIAAEDTRHSLKLLNYLDISKPMISYHRHNEDTKTETLINLLKDGKNIGFPFDVKDVPDTLSINIGLNVEELKDEIEDIGALWCDLRKEDEFTNITIKIEPEDDTYDVS